ncbi:unnamed protein product, partial [Rotaria sp. Silwood1]
SLVNDTPITEKDNTTTEPVPVPPPTTETTTEPNLEELRQRRLQFFNNKEKSTTDTKPLESNK